ncbi:MAG: CemA family protein [Nostoc sp.]
MGRDLDPDSEAQIIQEFQKSQTRTRIALRFIILLVIVPLLTQQLSKTFVFSPIVNHLQSANKIEIFLNYQQEEELFKEIDFFKKRISFEKLINEGSTLSQEKINNSIKEKSLELAQEYKAKSVDAIANIFADIGSLISFAFVVATSQREIKVLKSFLDEIIYGLSDSAKAFIIILSTDVFVGFHSTHGWEVLLEGVLQHFGLPENRDLIYLFIYLLLHSQ